MHANLIDSSHILRVILLVKAPISTSPTWNKEEILINKDLERFLSGCMPVIGVKPSSLGTRCDAGSSPVTQTYIRRCMVKRLAGPARFDSLR